MKKLLLVLVIGVLLFGVLCAPAVIGEKKEAGSYTKDDGGSSIADIPDELDQSQPDYVEGIGLPVGNIQLPDGPNLNFQVAQSFIPGKDILTRVEIYIGKNETAYYPYVVAIRDDLTEENIVETSVDPDKIETLNLSWVEFDFDDIEVTVGQTYYLVSYTENVTDNFYGWAANNDSESYPYGCAWMSTDDGDTWGNESLFSNQNNEKTRGGPRPVNDNNTWDMCFKTYGLDKTQLEIEIITGFTRPSAIIRNIGEVPAYELEYTVNIFGGIFGFINMTLEGDYPELPPGGELPIEFGTLFGFGPITIKVTASAYNADEVSEEVRKFILLFFIL